MKKMFKSMLFAIIMLGVMGQVKIWGKCSAGGYSFPNAQSCFTSIVPKDQCQKCKDAENKAAADDLAKRQSSVDQATLEKYITTQCETYKYVDDNTHNYHGDLNNPDAKKAQANDCKSIVTVAKASTFPQYPNSTYAVDELFSRWQKCAQTYYHRAVTQAEAEEYYKKHPDETVSFQDSISSAKPNGITRLWSYNTGLRNGSIYTSYFWKQWKPNPTNYPYQFAPFNAKAPALDPAKQSKHFQECLALPDKDPKKNDIAHINDIMKANVQEDIKELEAAKK